MYIKDSPLNKYIFSHNKFVCLVTVFGPPEFKNLRKRKVLKDVVVKCNVDLYLGGTNKFVIFTSCVNKITYFEMTFLGPTNPIIRG